MSTELMKNPQQHRKIFGLAAQNGIEIDQLRELSRETTGCGSLSKLTHAQAEKLIRRLSGSQRAKRGSKRTEQYRRRRTNTPQLVSRAQIDLIETRARHRGWTTQSLTDFCRRQCGHYPPQTTAQANKIIEALKAMDARDTRARAKREAA